MARLDQPPPAAATGGFDADGLEPGIEDVAMFGTESLARGGTVAPSTTRHFADFRDDWFSLALPHPTTSLEELFQAMAVPSDALPTIEFNPLRPRGSNIVAFCTVHGSTILHC